MNHKLFVLRYLPRSIAWSGVTVVLALSISAQATDFQPPVVYELAGSEPSDIHVADFNGDKLQDVLVSCRSNEGEVTVLLGDGQGGFKQIEETPTGLFAWGVAPGDFDEDGILDIVVMDGSQQADTARLFLGDGTGRFTPSTTLVTGSFPIRGVAADFNADQHLDLIVAKNVGLRAFVFMGHGDGTFDPGVQLPVSGNGGTRGVAAGDLDFDDDIDVIIDLGSSSAVLMNDGAGTFSVSGYAGPDGYQMILADLDDDWDLDLVGIGDDVEAALNDGSGAFTFVWTFPASWYLIGSGSVADITHDGIADVVTMNGSDGYVRIFSGLGNGNFAAPQQIWPGGAQPALVSTIDLDHDGYLDVVSSDRNYGDTALLNALIQIAPDPCLFDQNGDGTVGIADLLQLLSEWGICVGCSSDFDGNNNVNVADLLVLLANWGPC